MLLSCCCSFSISSVLASSSFEVGLVGGDGAPPEEDNDLSILFASSMSSFIDTSEGAEDWASVSFEEGVFSSPSIFMTFGLVGLLSAEVDLGLVHDDAM